MSPMYFQNVQDLYSVEQRDMFLVFPVQNVTLRIHF